MTDNAPVRMEMMRLSLMTEQNRQNRQNSVGDGAIEFPDVRVCADRERK